MLQHKPSQDTAHNALTSYIGNGLKFAEGFLVAALQKLRLIILTPFSCCFGSSVRQLFIFLSDKSLFLDLWKLGRKKNREKSAKSRLNSIFSLFSTFRCSGTGLTLQITERQTWQSKRRGKGCSTGPKLPCGVSVCIKLLKHANYCKARLKV